MVFDSINQYQPNRFTTIIEDGSLQADKDFENLVEQMRMQEELENIKNSATQDFILEAFSKNLKRIENIENKKQEQKYNSQPKRKEVEVKVTNTIPNITPKTVPYRMIHTHEIKN
ncbi:hypothetical protein [Helicobacter didelphidarum]|uniref:hypothetical protein n=1 Tax=Helicobacter didelphidarum TaxID=2040648 RepID=UPI0015F19595|nr:hypothetical protein [Helicobacter didelphidarum]